MTKEDIKKYRKKAYIKNRNKELVMNKKWRSKNPDYYKNYVINNKEKIKKYSEIWNKKNRESQRKKLRQWRSKNRKKTNLLYINWRRQKIKESVEYRLLCALRSRMHLAIKKVKNNKKSKSSMLLIGCSLSKLKIHLENQFDNKMNWDNHGLYWHIDHIIPCSSFDLTKKSQQIKCFNYKNLQPLEKIENIKKGNKIK